MFCDLKHASSFVLCTMETNRVKTRVRTVPETLCLLGLSRTEHSDNTTVMTICIFCNKL